MTDHSPDTGNMVDASPGQQIVAGMRDAVAMARAGTLEALALRCEAGEASREMDFAVAKAAFPDIGEARIFIVGDEEPIFFSEPYRKKPAPCFGTSLDAVASLQEAVLPGWSITSSTFVRPPSTRIFHPNYGNGSLVYLEGQAPTEPLARLAAILRALAAEIREGRSC